VQLYDLHVGPARLSRDAEDGCSSEHCSQCPGNSTCVGSMNSGSIPTCTCHPGLRGDNCDECTHSLIVPQSWCQKTRELGSSGVKRSMIHLAVLMQVTIVMYRLPTYLHLATSEM